MATKTRVDPERSGSRVSRIGVCVVKSFGFWFWNFAKKEWVSGDGVLSYQKRLSVSKKTQIGPNRDKYQELNKQKFSSFE